MVEQELDYVAIGKRIRKRRKEIGMTQDRLSEKVGLSPSHMSHIENGKTKVSLPSLVEIANMLQTSVDSFLYDNIQIMQEAYDKDFKDLLEDCTPEEREFLYLSTQQLKTALRKC